MNNVLWVVQKNLGSMADVHAIEATCEEIGCRCELVDVIPFSTELPDVPEGQPTVFYGSTNFTNNVYRANKWNPGIFFHPEDFKYSTYSAQYHGLMLNKVVIIDSLKKLSHSKFMEDFRVFVRPDNDSKAFSGMVLPFGEFKDWVDRLPGTDIDVHTPAVLARAKPIWMEWRLFMVNGKFVTGSRYRFMGTTEIDAYVPKDVIAFAEIACRVWSPATPVYVMDIAVVNPEEQEFAIIEINGFNSSGFYAADVNKIVREVTAVTLLESL